MKKFLKKNIIIKMVAIVLVAATVMGIAWNESFVKTKASGRNERKEVIDTKGDDEDEITEMLSEQEVVNYEVQQVNDSEVKTITIYGNGFRYEVICSLDGKKIEYIYDDSNNEIYHKETDMADTFEEFGLTGEEIEELIDEEDDFEGVDGEIANENITRGGKVLWSKAVKETYQNKYWYKTSKNTKTHWMRIGCDAKYQINLDKLSNYGADLANSYKKAIKSIINKVSISNNILQPLGCAGILIVLTVITGGLISGLTIPAIAAELASMPLLSGFSASSITAAVTSMYDAWAKYKEMQGIYKELRTYGKKYK